MADHKGKGKSARTNALTSASSAAPADLPRNTFTESRRAVAQASTSLSRYPPVRVIVYHDVAEMNLLVKAQKPATPDASSELLSDSASDTSESPGYFPVHLRYTPSGDLCQDWAVKKLQELGLKLDEQSKRIDVLEEENEKEMAKHIYIEDPEGNNQKPGKRKRSKLLTLRPHWLERVCTSRKKCGYFHPPEHR